MIYPNLCGIPWDRKEIPQPGYFLSMKHQELDTSDAGVGDISKVRLQELLCWVGVLFNENQKVFGRPGIRVISTFLSEKIVKAAGGVQ